MWVYIIYFILLLFCLFLCYKESLHFINFFHSFSLIFFYEKGKLFFFFLFLTLCVKWKTFSGTLNLNSFFSFSLFVHEMKFFKLPEELSTFFAPFFPSNVLYLSNLFDFIWYRVSDSIGNILSDFFFVLTFILKLRFFLIFFLKKKKFLKQSWAFSNKIELSRTR